MRDYVIFTDSACDIKPELLAEWGVPYRSLTFRFDGEEKEYSNDDMSVKEFYDKMRAGSVAKTAAVTPEAFARFCFLNCGVPSSASGILIRSI